MTNDDKAAFLKELAKLALVYRSLQLSEPLVEIWWEALHDVALTEIRRAVAEYVRGEDDFPTPGKIRAIALPVDDGSSWIALEWERIEREEAARNARKKDIINAPTH